MKRSLLFLSLSIVLFVLSSSPDCAALMDLMRREQTFTERETQLSVELDKERANLADLNKRLDALEREIVMTGLSDDGKRNPK